MNVLPSSALLQNLSLTMLPPLLLGVLMAVGDVRTRRIPNYLTLGGALGGLLAQTLAAGWPGFLLGLGGLAVGFGLMLPLYIFAGMGAGDVKAVGALGAWLTPWHSLSLFCYMIMAGGIVALGVLIWQGVLWQCLRRTWQVLLHLFLTRDRGMMTSPGPRPPHCRGDHALCPGHRFGYGGPGGLGAYPLAILIMLP